MWRGFVDSLNRQSILEKIQFREWGFISILPLVLVLAGENWYTVMAQSIGPERITIVRYQIAHTGIVERVGRGAGCDYRYPGSGQGGIHFMVGAADSRHRLGDRLHAGTHFDPPVVTAFPQPAFPGTGPLQPTSGQRGALGKGSQLGIGDIRIHRAEPGKGPEPTIRPRHHPLHPHDIHESP
jgi:hypothetical protein